jgi:3-carboxy-cis,cis-muconate cycloisomerase
MAIGALDSAIFADMFGTAAMREIFGDDAFLMRCVEVEAALARAQARLGIIPAEAADAITHAAAALVAGREALDPARLKRETETVGYPILPLIRQLAELAGPSGRYLHWGATTQDIMDTAAVLQIRAGLDLVEEDLTAVRSHLAECARKYRDTPMAGRTHLQHALPITFGYKAAVWLYALDRHAERLRQLRPRVLLAQFGGAAGTLASLTMLRRPWRAAPSSPVSSHWVIRRSPGMSSATALPRPCRFWRCWSAASARSRSTSC